MNPLDKTSSYIKKRLRQKGFVSKNGNKTSKIRTLGELKRSQNSNRNTGIVKSPYRIEKQLNDDNPKYKSEFQWLFNPVKGVSWDFNPVALRQLAQSDAWVQMLVNTMTQEIANTPWQIVEDDGSEVQKNLNPFQKISKGISKDPATNLEASRARKFLKNPNPDQDFTDFIESLTADYFEIGSLTSVKAFDQNDYNGDVLDTNNPDLIHALPSDPVTWTKEYRGKTGVVNGYWQYDRSNGSQSNQFRTTSSSRSDPTRFAREEVAWKDINPRTNRRYGMPPTLAVRNILQLMDLTIEQEQDFFARGAHLAGFLKSNGDIEEVDTLGDEVAGEQGRVGGFFQVNDPEAEWVQMGSNWKEMDMTQREKWYAQVIASEFQVPTSVVGLETEEINRATFEAERGNFESNTLGPYLQDIERWITMNFIKPYFSKDLRFEFKPGMSEQQRNSISERIRGEFNSGLVTRNEARREIGYQSVEDEAENGFKDDVVNESNGSGIDPSSLQVSESSENSSGLKPKEEEVENGLSKSFGPWENFEECVTEMESEGHDQETAKRICGSLQAELKQEGRVEKQESFTDYPDAAVENAEMALNARKDTGNPNDCGTGAGWARANQLANREPVSMDTVKRMSQFRRHQDNKDQGEDGRSDCGWMMWKAWGGDEGIAWAERKVDEAEESKSCDYCGDKIEKTENKRFCSKSCYHKFLSKEDNDEPLRGSDNFFEYDFQPRHVEQFKEELQGPLKETLNSIFNDDRFRQLIERFAESNDNTENTSKNSAELRRVLNQLIRDAATAKGLEKIIRDQNVAIATVTLTDQISDSGLEADIDEVQERIENRELNFVNDFSQRMEEDFRDIISNGWQQGDSINDIQESLQSKASKLTDHQAERIARDQLQRSTGEARNAFAEQHSDKFVEVWNSVDDDRTRPGHSDMQGKWKRSSEKFVVDYERAQSPVEEKFPGDSEYGIQCRCRTDLVSQEEVSNKDYGGNNKP